MADILKVTTPTTNYDTTARTNPITTSDVNIQNVIDPTKVTRPDGQTSENTENKFALNYGSNFDRFVNMLKNTQGLTQTMATMLFTQLETIVSSGLGENFAQEISQFMEMINMSEADVLNFLKNQSSQSVKFQGPFFDILRQALEQTNSVEMKSDILNFVKKFNDTVSEKHIFGNILQSLNDIAKNMPKSYREPLLALMPQLKSIAHPNSNAINSAVLKNEIIPYLSQYVGRTHDLGKVRDLITMLTLNMARYENANPDSFKMELQKLMGYKAIKGRLGDIDLKQLEGYLLTSGKHLDELSQQKSAVMDKLISIIKRGMSGEAGYEAKPVFENIVKSILINESVYMPLMHMILPANVDGRMMFSEIWVDPDSEDSLSTSPEERNIKLLIKFDIKDVGFFDLIVNSQGQNVDLQLFYPERLSSMENVIKKAIGNIVEENGFHFRNLMVEKSIRPKTISEVFPKIQERKNSINVSI